MILETAVEIVMTGDLMTEKSEWEKNIQNIDFINQPLINGRFVDSSAEQMISKKSPVDGRSLPDIFTCEDKEVNDAVEAAKMSHEDGRWWKLSLSKRKKILLTLADLIEKHSEKLALLDSLTMGKAISACREHDNPKGVECIRWFAEAIDKHYDECVPSKYGALGTITREPLGVVSAITPWNYPVENICWKIGPALAAGNSLVLKPSEESTFSALLVGKLALEAGIPDGVINIIPGLGSVTGKALALHHDVDAVFFTGSTKTGKSVVQYSGHSNLKRVGLECGGKSAFILLNDWDDLEKAAHVLLKSIFFNQGQTCSAPSRLIIQKDLQTSFVERLIELAPHYHPENPLDHRTKIGAMVSHDHLKKVLGIIQKGVSEGAELIYGGHEEIPVSGGAYCQPTIFNHVENDMVIAREEIFGPVLSIIEVTSISEAIEVANDSHYGLAASVWTKDIDHAHLIARELNTGFVHVNSYGDDDMTAPFGGYKMSGNGSKDKSLHALNDYSNVKTTWFEFKRNF